MNITNDTTAPGAALALQSPSTGFQVRGSKRGGRPTSWEPTVLSVPGTTFYGLRRAEDGKVEVYRLDTGSTVATYGRGIYRRSYSHGEGRLHYGAWSLIA